MAETVRAPLGAKLQLLDMSSREIPPDQLAALTTLTSLTEVRLIYSEHDSNAGAAAGLAAWAALPGSQTGIAQRLQVLKLHWAGFNDAQVRQLVGCLRGGALRMLAIT
eukprot:gene443-706_t